VLLPPELELPEPEVPEPLDRVLPLTPDEEPEPDEDAMNSLSEMRPSLSVSSVLN
jgi:hypothetical protein